MDKIRTDQQRKSIEVYCRQMADVLNDAGFDQKAVITQFKDGFSIPWSQESVKHLFRCVATALYEKEHTSDLLTDELQRVYEIFNARIHEITGGASVRWPSLQSLRDDAQEREWMKGQNKQCEKGLS